MRAVSPLRLLFASGGGVRADRIDPRSNSAHCSGADDRSFRLYCFVHGPAERGVQYVGEVLGIEAGFFSIATLLERIAPLAHVWQPAARHISKPRVRSHN